jgi:hypothetical protein
MFRGFHIFQSILVDRQLPPQQFRYQHPVVVVGSRHNIHLDYHYYSSSLRYYVLNVAPLIDTRRYWVSSVHIVLMACHTKVLYGQCVTTADHNKTFLKKKHKVRTSKSPLCLKHIIHLSVKQKLW